MNYNFRISWGGIMIDDEDDPFRLDTILTKKIILYHHEYVFLKEQIILKNLDAKKAKFFT